MNIFDYQKQSLDLISKSMGLPTFDESMEDLQGEATDKMTKAEEEMEDEQATIDYMDRRMDEGMKWGEPPINKETQK